MPQLLINIYIQTIGASLAAIKYPLIKVGSLRREEKLIPKPRVGTRKR